MAANVDVVDERVEEALVSVTGLSSRNILRIPAAVETGVQMRYSPLRARDKFNPRSWISVPLTSSPHAAGYYEINLVGLKLPGYEHLPDGAYEYEFVLDGDVDHPVADPYATEITKFGGYRGVFRIEHGRRWQLPFSWDDEFPEGVQLANNHELVIYEMPMRWMESAPQRIRQVGLGTFERAAFMRLDELKELGINAIELLPVLDSADTLNWGYGTRFFFAPDIDMGTPVDLKYFVKQCHRRGIRVIFDVVMNHARGCPLQKLDSKKFFLKEDNPQEEELGRGESWGGRMFRYRTMIDGQFPAREFHHQVAEFLICEYHADGFRVDEFRGIDNWDFMQEFRDRAWGVHQTAFPGRPFVVIAEHSARETKITHDGCHNGRKIVDSMWNFGFRDETRRLLRSEMHTDWGQPRRRDRICWTISGRQTWDDYSHQVKDGFYDMAQAVNYLTSHDVEKDAEKRIMNHLLEPLLRQHGFGYTWEHISWIADHLDGGYEGRANQQQRFDHGVALERLRSAFGLLMTSVGIPMILAGDEFGDVHDLDHKNYRYKMSDPVDWQRKDCCRYPNNHALRSGVGKLIKQRTSHPALLRNEIDFFYFHPTIDETDGERVFAYARTRGEPLGRQQQVVVVANVGPSDYPQFDLPWHWPDVTEIAPPTYKMDLHIPASQTWARLSLAPYQVRVFAT